MKIYMNTDVAGAMLRLKFQNDICTITGVTVIFIPKNSFFSKNRKIKKKWKNQLIMIRSSPKLNVTCVLMRKMSCKILERYLRNYGSCNNKHWKKNIFSTIFWRRKKNFLRHLICIDLHENLYKYWCRRCEVTIEISKRYMHNNGSYGHFYPEKIIFSKNRKIKNKWRNQLIMIRSSPKLNVTCVLMQQRSL